MVETEFKVFVSVALVIVLSIAIERVFRFNRPKRGFLTLMRWATLLRWRVNPRSTHLYFRLYATYTGSLWRVLIYPAKDTMFMSFVSRHGLFRRGESFTASITAEQSDDLFRWARKRLPGDIAILNQDRNTDPSTLAFFGKDTRGEQWQCAISFRDINNCSKELSGFTREFLSKVQQLVDGAELGDNETVWSSPET